MLATDVVDKAARTLLAAAPPGSKVILFGSRARGDARAESDADFLVVEPQVVDPHREMVRLAAVLWPLKVAADVLVVSAERFDYWRDTPNTLYCHAAKEGVVYG